MPPSDSRKHPRDEDAKHYDASKKRKSSDGVRHMFSEGTNSQKTPISPPPKRSTADDIADAKARIAQMMKKTKPTSSTPSTSSPANAANAKMSIEERIAVTKARIAAKGQVLQQNVQALAKAEEDAKQARGGLSVNVHPSLLADLPTSDRRNRNGHVAPKFSTTLANLNRQTEVVARRAIKKEQGKEKEKKMEIFTKPAESDFSTDNPYFDPKLDTAYSVQKDRKTRPMVFNPHGKYIEKAQADRAAAKMEVLKKKIEERARKAGLEEDLDVGDREVLLRPPPPEVEWWDDDLLTNGTYDDLDVDKVKLDGDETKITLYIQNPIPIPPPSSTHAPLARPVMMTAKEMAKARRLRRAEEQKDIRGRILLGLMPPDPPKIKMSNLMRVLTSEAVRDPTAVEQRVRKEVDLRKTKHEDDNQGRKLTKEERHAKDSEKREADVVRTGLHCCLFRVDNLSNPAHLWKIKRNAQQLELTGIIILNPRTNIVIVEGGLPAINRYKRLMTVRMNWTDNSRNATMAQGNREILGDQPPIEDLSNNSCQLIWEGELKARNFKVWVGEREANNDIAARKWLGKGAEYFWRLAVRSDGT